MKTVVHAGFQAQGHIYAIAVAIHQRLVGQQILQGVRITLGLV
jgi:hypothetical protein